MTTLKIGYDAPTGERGIETITPATFPHDLAAVCDIAATFADVFWVSDHLMRDANYRLECWTQLTWLAARYAGQRLGCNVMCNSFRHPPLVAKMGATLQELTRGRFILGLGAGSLEDEHAAYGYLFPSTRQRIEQMVEGIKAIRALWTEQPASFSGRYYQVSDVHFNPPPQPVPPIMVGGDGERFLLRAVAEHADWWLASWRSEEVMRRKLEVLANHCADVGRNPASIHKVHPLTVFLAPTREGAQRAAGSRLESSRPPFAGSPDDLVERLEFVRSLGFGEVAMAFGGFPGTSDLELFRDRVLPQLG